ncbi:MAG: S8 family serine peptidase [Bacteroidota bacterium]
MAEGSEKAFMVSQKHGDKIVGEYILMYKENIPYFERLDAETHINEVNSTRSTRESAMEMAAKRETAIESFAVENLKKHQLSISNLKKVYDIGRTKGALVTLNAEQAEELAQDEEIESVEPNQIIAMNLNPGSKSRLVPADNGPANQWTTYNVSAIGGARDHSNGQTWAFIIDSGIDLDHPDLNVQPNVSRSFVSYESSPNDEFGHGTHVAGIIGAKNDGKGVVGVASGATLVALKVLDRNGYGTTDNLLQALSFVHIYCIPGDVVNISLGTEKSPVIDNAILNLKNIRGVYFTIAAGNDGENTYNYSPASLADANIYVVGSVNIWEYLSGFSNYGPSVGYLAPGDGIYSTYKNGQYAWMSGTSMAAPHVAGILLAGQGGYGVRKQLRLPSGNYAKVVKQK